MKDILLELIRKTSSFLPPDVEETILALSKLEEKNSMASFAMELVQKNSNLAKQRSLPICQDTGTITFYVKKPKGFSEKKFIKDAESAVEEATKVGYLRQNSVDSITGKNPGNNLGPGSPVFYFEEWEKDDIEIKLILKGGGCENCSTQYSLPTTIEGKKYGRDLEGVKAVILDGIFKAQGKGCAPGFIGVCIGGDRANSYSYAKKQLLREISDLNPDPKLAELEKKIFEEANKLNIGPMGFSGKFTIGGCKIGSLMRLPASFFVSIAYMCWAYRRRGVLLSKKGKVVKWLYEKDEEFKDLEKLDVKFEPKADVKILNTPLKEEDVRALNVGDMVLLNGQIFTGRDAVHKYLYEGGELPQIKGGIIYHCGPVVVEKGGKYEVVAAGPTTSIREEPYQGEIIKKFGIKGVIGKGGMGQNTLKALKEHGAVYFHAIGGAAQIYAILTKKVNGVYLKEFGSPEAVWDFEVENYPLVVTMDSKGNSLHQIVEDKSREVLKNLI